MAFSPSYPEEEEGRDEEPFGLTPSFREGWCLRGLRAEHKAHRELTHVWKHQNRPSSKGTLLCSCSKPLSAGHMPLTGCAEAGTRGDSHRESNLYGVYRAGGRRDGLKGDGATEKHRDTTIAQWLAASIAGQTSIYSTTPRGRVPPWQMKTAGSAEDPALGVCLHRGCT